jgi:hypothetical protein
VHHQRRLQFFGWQRWLLVAMAMLVLAGGSLMWQAVSHGLNTPDMVVPFWTRSYQLYRQPHAVWLSGYEYIGVNLPTLKQTLEAGLAQKKRPEIVVYGIPYRDMGQSSAGGFDTYAMYFADNDRNAAAIKAFMDKGGKAPRVYLEPDAMGHAIQYRKDRDFDAVSEELYRVRVAAMNRLVDQYKAVGALVYLDAAHSDWFDYTDEQVRDMADVLNASGMARAHGVATNISNRQTAAGPAERTEVHYLKRLLPKLNHPNPDVVMDTSRNGGPTHQRHYWLADNGDMVDNETPSGRWVGRWEKLGTSDKVLKPLFGKAMKVSVLTGLDKFSYDASKHILSAPKWLDPVGDVKLGPPPTDNTGHAEINRYRYIKPPDDCDGALNCPSRIDEHASSNSKHDVWAETANHPNQQRYTDPRLWHRLR